MTKSDLKREAAVWGVSIALGFGLASFLRAIWQVPILFFFIMIPLLLLAALTGDVTVFEFFKYAVDIVLIFWMIMTLGMFVSGQFGMGLISLVGLLLVAMAWNGLSHGHVDQSRAQWNRDYNQTAECRWQEDNCYSRRLADLKALRAARSAAEAHTSASASPSTTTVATEGGVWPFIYAIGKAFLFFGVVILIKFGFECFRINKQATQNARLTLERAEQRRIEPRLR